MLSGQNTYRVLASSNWPGPAAMRAGTVPAPPYPYLYMVQLLLFV
jgi:hypothetical protein